MNTPDPPKLIEKSAEDLLCQMVKKIPEHWPEWKREVPQKRHEILALAEDPADFGMAFLKLAARMGEVILAQLNRVPEKNFLAFLDMLGIDLLPPKAARVPLTFTLVEKAPRDGVVPKHTRVAVAKADNVIFETDEHFSVARVLLTDAIAVNSEKDRFANLSKLINHNTSSEVNLFGLGGQTSEWGVLDHVLYIGHPRIFDLAHEAEVSLTITLTADKEIPIVQWEYFGEDGWKPFLKQPSDSDVSLTLPPLTPVSAKEAIPSNYDILNFPSDPISWIRVKTTDRSPIE